MPFEWYEFGLGILIAVVLAAVLWGPYLYKEIHTGKADVGARKPLGPGDVHAGTRFDPAPDQPDGQADPFSRRAQRDAPPVKS